jgi:hypothetical protein
MTRCCRSTTVSPQPRSTDQRYPTEFHVTRRVGNVEVEATVDGHGYPEFKRDTLQLVVHGARPPNVSVNGSPVVSEGGRVVIPNIGEPFMVKFAVQRRSGCRAMGESSRDRPPPP